MIDITLNEIIPCHDGKNRLPDDWSVKCLYLECGWEGIISECETEMENDGWENPPYEVLVCPRCGGTDIEV